ncbi:MAG: methylmalonyl-CoA mutase family protein [Polaromonas sp.]|nr:methylmalonyl-CoA mutase family protein [Polaromonas sp.]
MTDLSTDYKALASYRPTNKVRFVTAASLFDGHDAAINIMRRILQGMGAEVIHLGHNRSVDEVVTAALQEDAQGIAISSYQGGHVEYFKYMVDLLKSRGGEHIQVFGGGGGVIVGPEIRELHAYGVSHIFSPEDGQRMGLQGMIGEMVMRCDKDLSGFAPTALSAIEGHSEMAWRALAQLITALEAEKADAALVDAVRVQAATKTIPVLGITGTGGAGKSSLTDELIRRLRLDQGDQLRVALISIDPSRRKSGGARNKEAWNTPTEQMPVFGTMAARFNDDGVTALYQALKVRLNALGLKLNDGALPLVNVRHSTNQTPVVPAARTRYLAEITDTVRGYKQRGREQARLAREIQQLRATSGMLSASKTATADAVEAVIGLAVERELVQDPAAKKLLTQWPAMQKAYAGDEYIVKIRDKEIRTALTSKSLSGTTLRKVALPQYEDHGEILKWLTLDNVPGSYPYTAGTFAFKREGEDPTRMFAGEGDPFRTNRRFRLLSDGMEAKRLSTAFDSVTLYGNDPDPRPDIYGKVGNSGVSIATLDDLKVLYSGFDLCSPTTSVSMTINGPAPSILAMFMNAAIDQNLEKFKTDNGREATETETAKIREWVQANVRGTVQADILKEDQGQNTCIFSTEFSLKVMGDIAEYFVHHNVRNFYSVSISGYHIAEAGANPISQLAFTLSNGFTFVEAYLARGMHIDDFAPNLSFFFSNGMDPEYTVMGRVARRIWAVAMKEKYGANERSQKLKYHIQTSGRSLHAQEIQFNDIRTTLQALIAIYDNCNSLHTNAFDEAITTPTEDSVRRAMAIQLIINREWGLAKNENPSQGAFIIEELTELVEEAVLAEFQNIADRGGVLGAMETGYQRGRIQDESMHYEMLKHTGELPIIGVNTFRNPHGDAVHDKLELARSTDEEKQSQLQRLADFHTRHADAAPAQLKRLQQAVIENKNVFEVLMDAVRVCSLGQITNALFEVGGQYRRNM